MRVVMGAQNCGFGPASELIAIARLLGAHDRVFVGEGVSALFVRGNADAFDEIHDLTDPGRDDAGGVDGLIRGADLVISVMDADLVVRAVIADRPAVLVDSLFPFWKLAISLTAIGDLCVTMPVCSYEAAERHLASLSDHERVVAAHLLADRSVVQNFPGVAARRAEFATVRDAPVFDVVGSLIDMEGVRQSAAGGNVAAADLLIDVAGFQNFLLDFDTHNGYVRLLLWWLHDLLRDWPMFRRVLVCGGPFHGSRAVTVSVAGRTAECRMLGQREFLRQAASIEHHLMAPGLTALHEAMALDRFPLALPEQHYAHVFTVRELDATLFGKSAMRLCDAIPDLRVPDDDLDGTAALAGAAQRVLDDADLYARFRRAANQRIDAYLSLTPLDRRNGVQELRDAFRGPSLTEVVDRIVRFTAARSTHGTADNVMRQGNGHD
jgi:hypothetical protein